ncbi:MAG: sigma-54-dependent Fis family transcriptional regulator [Candidatus Eisenbacteria bacterium]|nr:sigma-54-dependent Fis family transcriptional regulator [Candidatus Eisenbacteria bacterium]MCC7140987.1 sigma-54-dependent Fis family transcriptional regulator [Candidatus Eisenbacteria bacterium]
MSRSAKETVDRPEERFGERAGAASARLSSALVLLWSGSEPERAGEVLLLRGGNRGGCIGRFDPDYDYEGNDPIPPLRQRPGVNDERPPLTTAQHVSRRQLDIAAERGGRVRATVVGKAEVQRNGGDALRDGESIVLDPGDTMAIGQDLLFLCQPRPAKLESLRFYPAPLLPEFGAADRAGIVGESPAIWQLRDRLAFVAQMSQHALVTGPTGSGKELAARAIHLLSTRAAQPIVAHSAADIPPSLVEAELFGNRPNYPNPGMPGREGLIGAADGSTLFLDELGVLPLDLQAKLLRVLDDHGSFRKLGVDEPQTSDLRLVAATNRPLDTIKHDVLARLKHVIPIPPLEDRREDIPLLLHRLIARMREKESDAKVVARFVDPRSGLPRLSIALVDALVRHLYQANLRELDQLLLAAIYQSTGERIELGADLRDQLRFPEPEETADPEERSCEEVRAALEGADWNISATAAQLGWSRFQLNRKMKKCGLSREGK